ncbi:MAG: type III secretion system chaperone [Pseudomonadota bacterium]
MMQREQAHILIQQLGTAVGMPLILDDAGMCLLALEDDTVISIGYDITRQQLVLFAPLEAVEPTERVLRAMLSANFLWHSTEGSTLALNPGGNAAVLQRALPEILDVSDLQASFTAFASQTQAWNRTLAAQETALASPSTLPDPMMMRV